MTCPHHWILPPAEGPTSLGTCQRCGAEKEFKNGTPDDNAVWGKTYPLGRPRYAE